MRILFFGTPELAAPFLQDLADEHEVVGVVSQPDKPVGRGLELAPTPVKRLALSRGLKVYQPAKPSELAAELKGLGADLGVTVAYGKILKPEVLSAPRLGCVNVHFSLLPKYRGAAPIQWSLIRGERESGVTIFWMDEGMDTGPVLVQKKLAVGPEEDALSLGVRLVELGRIALKEALALAELPDPPRIPQTGEASLAPKLAKEDGRLDLGASAAELHDRVRGVRAWPRASLQVGGKTLLVLKTRVEDDEKPGSPGRVAQIEPGGAVLVECRVGRVWLETVQPEGRAPMPAASFLNGLRLGAGDRIG